MRLSTFAYLTLMVFGALTGLVKFFALGRLLTKGDFGEYSFLNAVVTYSIPIASFGLLEGLGRRFPILLGEKRDAEAYVIRNRAIGAMALAAVVAMVLAAVSSFAFEQVTGRPAFLVSTLIAVEIYAYIAYTMGLRDVRNHLNLSLYAGLTFAKGAIDLALVFLIAPRYGFMGVLVAETVVLILMAALIGGGYMKQFRVETHSLRTLLPMVSQGILLSIVSALANTVRMADRLVLGLLLPNARFADYAFHLLVVNAGGIVANVLGQYVTPHALHLFGRSGRSAKHVYDYLGRMTIFVLIAGAGAAVLVPFGFKLASSHFFKGYAVDVPLLLVLYAAGVIDVANLFPMALVTLGKLHAMTIIHAVVGGLLVAACFIGAKLGAGLLLFAVLALTARVIIFVATGLVTRRAAQNPVVVVHDPVVL